jgi:hypothetical protein
MINLFYNMNSLSNDSTCNCNPENMNIMKTMLLANSKNVDIYIDTLKKSKDEMQKEIQIFVNYLNNIQNNCSLILEEQYEKYKAMKANINTLIEKVQQESSI